MNKKYIIGILVIVVAVFAWFFFGRKAVVAPSTPEAATSGVVTTSVTKTGVRPPSTSAPVLTKTGAYLVSYTGHGFSPAKLTIKRGKSVHFVNNSSKAMSLTAVDQMSQTYRELNQEQSVGRGGFYDFTFLAPGTWDYMNRNSQTNRGTIIVE